MGAEQDKTKKIKCEHIEKRFDVEEGGDRYLQLLVDTYATDDVTTMSMTYNRITKDGMLSFSKASWNNLTRVVLSDNLIGNEGCKYLTRASLKSMQILNLRNNNIRKVGCFHLSKSRWRSIDVVFLDQNNIQVDALVHLLRGKWRQTCSIYISLWFEHKYPNLPMTDRKNIVTLLEWQGRSSFSEYGLILQAKRKVAGKSDFI